MKTSLVRISLLPLAFLGPMLPAQQTRTLLATPKTVAWGYYWSQAKPVLTVSSGDTVTIQTLSTCGPPERLEQRGILAKDIPPYVSEVYAGVPQAERGPGGHILTGPIAITEAEPGDVLEVRIWKIGVDVPWACNGTSRNGFLSKDFPKNFSKIIPLDLKTMTAAFGPGITIPLHPFFGSMGVAPPAGARQGKLCATRHLGRKHGQQGTGRGHDAVQSRCMRPERSSKQAMGMPGKATARSISPPLRLS